MKNLVLLPVLLLVIGFAQTLSAQNTFPANGAAGIGTSTPASSSLLDISSTSKGVLMPRMTKTQREAIVSPVEGLLIYQTNNQPGFYYYDGSAWKSVLQVKKDLSNLNATAINVSLEPNASGTLNLGSSTNKWNEVHATSIKFADGTTQSTAGGGGGGGIGGAGTSGYLAKFTAAGTIGNSLIQENASNAWLGTTAFSGINAKLDVYADAIGRTLKLQNDFSTTSTKEGIYNWVGAQGTGGKTGINNIVWQTTGSTGIVYGVKQDIQNYGSGNGYANYATYDILGSGTNYGNYLSIGGSSSGTVYGDYKSVSGGTVYGDYKTLSGSNSVYGNYITIPSVSGSNTKFGVYVNIPSTAGANFGIYSVVNTDNAGSYAASFTGKVYCNGDVGIGTISPAAQLHVDLGTDAEPAGGGFIVSGSTSSANIAIDNNEIMARDNGAVSKLYLNNDGGDVSMCYAGGNVMIGASAPATGYLLTVDGKVICEELKVQLSQDWPDYVFEEGYAMPSISELKAFVKTHKHLPGIPDAEEMKAGISVGDMQTKLMQKVEELSLYIIQLQDQIDALRQQ